MEFVTDISEKEYENFVLNHEKSHFMQSYYFGEIRKEKGFIPHYVGIKENGALLATALLLEKKLIFKYSYFYCPRGFVIDYKNKELVTLFTKYLKKYSIEKNILFLRMDPDLNINTNLEVIDLLKNLGYKHKGFNKGFENEQPRFTFRLNLKRNIDELYKEIHPTTRKILNKGNQYNLNIYIGNNEDIDSFYETMIETAKRDKLIQSPIEYYKSFYEILNKKNMSDLYIAKVDINDLKQIYSNKLEELNNELNCIDKEKYQNIDKYNNKINELNNQIERLIKDIDSLKDIKENSVVLASIITVKYGNKVWTVHGGNNSKLMNLNANYLLYYTIIKDSLEQKYELIDFFGTTGIENPDPKDPIYGIHFFKKRFGGDLCEFIGEFDLVTNKFIYNIYIKLLPIYRKLKK